MPHCNHLFCHRCYAERFGGSLLDWQLVHPAQLVEAPTDICCACGELTRNGVYRLTDKPERFCPHSLEVSLTARRRSKIESAKPYVPEHDFRLSEDDCQKLRQLLPEDLVQEALNRANAGPEANDRVRQLTRSMEAEKELYETAVALEAARDAYAKRGDLAKVIEVQQEQIAVLTRELKRVKAVHVRELAEAREVMAVNSEPTR
jgi:hypothetical protein